MESKICHLKNLHLYPFIYQRLHKIGYYELETGEYKIKSKLLTFKLSVCIEKEDANNNVCMNYSFYVFNGNLFSYIKCVYYEGENLIQMDDIRTQDNNTELMGKYKGKAINIDQFI